MAFTLFRISFVLLHLHNGTECARPTRLQSDMCNHLQQERHWQGMGFHEFKHEGHRWQSITKIKTMNCTFKVVDRLSLVSPMMSCVYGTNLNRYLLLTLEAIDECTKLRGNDEELAADCNDKVGESVERGTNVIYKLMGTLKIIDPDGLVSMDQNRFYNVLLPLYDVATGEVPIQFSGIVPGGLIVNELFNGVAESIRKLLYRTCRPTHANVSMYETLSIKKLKSEYNGDPNGIYLFYTAKLHTYIGFINDHLIQLGFHYNEAMDRITFDPSNSG